MTAQEGSRDATEEACASATLTVSKKVIVEMVREAALEVPGVLRVGRGGSAFLAFLAGSPARVRLRDGHVSVRLWVIARPGQPLRPLSEQVRQAVAATVRRLLGLEPDEVSVIVDGVGSRGA